MRFQLIKVAAEEVTLIRLDKQTDGSMLKLELTNPSRPLPEFAAALQAFSGYSVDLIGAPHWHEEVKVSSVHLSEEPRTNKRGLIVTFTRRIERAKNRVFLGNTPLMHAPAEDAEGTSPGTFPREVAEMVATLEAEATRYWNGEREQGEMFAPGTAPAAAADEKPRVDGPRDQLAAKRSRKKGTPGGAAPGEVQNPDSTDILTDERLRSLLLRAGRDLPIDAIALMLSSERQQVAAWAFAVTDPTIMEKNHPAEPQFLKENATPALLDTLAQSEGAPT